MSSVLKTLIEPQDLPTSATLLYTVPAGTRTTITKLTLVNHTASSQTATLYLVDPGGVVADRNKIIDQRGLTERESLDVAVSRHTLTSGTEVHGLASQVNAVSIRASGQETT